MLIYGCQWPSWLLLWLLSCQDYLALSNSALDLYLSQKEPVYHDHDDWRKVIFLYLIELMFRWYVFRRDLLGSGGLSPLTPKYFLQYACTDPMGSSNSVIDYSDHIWWSSTSQASHSTLATHSCGVMYMLKIQFNWCTGLLSSIFICCSGSFQLHPNMPRPIAVQLGVNV